MTDPQYYAPYTISPDQANTSVHGPLPRAGGEVAFPFTWQQLQQIVAGFVNEFLRQVAVALGAVEIFGWHPYEALVDIGEQIAAAQTNFNQLLSGLGVPDIPGVVGYFGHLGATGLYNAAAGFGNTASSLLKYLTPTGGNIGQFDASQLTGALNTALTFSGTALNVLLQHLNSSGQFAASALTGGINTAVTFGGTALSTLLGNINSTGQFAASALTGAVNTAITVGGTAIGTVASNAVGLVEGINNAAAGLISGGSTLLADAQTNLGLLLGAAPAYLQGLSGIFGQAATNTAFAAAASAAAAQAAQLAQQQSAFNAVFNVGPASAGNVNVTVDFSGMANAANMSGVMLPGSTGIGITSGAAALQSLTASNAEVFPTPTVTDYQVITATLGPLNDLLSGLAATYVAGRENSARTTKVAVEVSAYGGAPTLRLICFVSGTPTYLTSAVTVPGLATGGVIRLILGDPSSASPYAMQVLYNGAPVITFTDSSHVSQLGGSTRYVGLDMVTLGGYPPAIRSVTYQDNPPPPTAYPFSGRPAADVAAKGRQYASSDCGRIDRDNGGAWENIYLGPKAFAVEPPQSGWSWVNQGGATIAADADALLLTAPSSTRNWRMRTRTLSPTSNYTATAELEAAGPLPSSSNRWYAHMGLRNSSSGSFISFGPSLYAASSLGAVLTVYRWTNATTFSASSFEDVIKVGVPQWLRIRDDGTNRYFEFTMNGVDWVTVFSESRTAFITPDQWFIGVDNEGSGGDVKLRYRSHAGIS